MSDDDTRVRMFPFAVGHRVSDERAKEVLEGLHNLVELGKQAASALRSIEINGCCDKYVPYVQSSYEGTPNTRHGKYARIEYINLPKIVPISRQDLPRLAECEAILGSPRNIIVKGAEYQQAVFGVRIHGIEQTKESGVYVAKTYDRKIGEIRYNKKRLMYVDPNENAFQLSKAPHANPRAMEAIVRIAQLISEASVYTPENWGSHRASQKTVDLRVEAQKWLLEEKIVHNMILDIFNMNAVREVLES